MDFGLAAAKHDMALQWFEELGADGKSCTTLTFGSMQPVPREYRSAVAWHNIYLDGRLDAEERKLFARMAGIGWRELSGSSPTPSYPDVCLPDALPEVEATTYGKKLIGSGPKAKLDPSEPGSEWLCTLVTPPAPGSGEPPDPDDPSIAVPTWVAGAILQRVLNREEHDPVWLTRYDDLAELLKGESARDAIAKVGIVRDERATAGASAPLNTIFLLRVRTAAIHKHLRVATVADSRLWYLFQATKSGPAGRTRNTEHGLEEGVPEFVVKREHLLTAANDDPSAVALLPRVWYTGAVAMTPVHASTRWHDEIKSTIS